MAKQHLIGLLLATEEDWPSAFEAVTRRLGSLRYRSLGANSAPRRHRLCFAEPSS
jgi:hypothetical protein